MKYLIFLLLPLVLFASCNKDYKRENIDSNVLVYVEIIENTIVLHGLTEKSYNCLGHQIIYCEKTRKNKIHIELKKSNVPAVCQTATGPATCKIEFNNLDAGEYEVTFKLNKEITKGKLLVGTPTELTLSSGNVRVKQ